MSRIKRASNELKYYNILQSACNPTEWRTIAETAVRQAQQGDHAARKWLSDYLLGPAIKRFELMLEHNKKLEIEHKIDLSVLDNSELDILDMLSSKLYDNVVDVLPNDNSIMDQTKHNTSENTIIGQDNEAIPLLPSVNETVAFLPEKDNTFVIPEHIETQGKLHKDFNGDTIVLLPEDDTIDNDSTIDDAPF